MSDVPRTLLSLVQAYSPTGGEAAAVQTLVRRMQALRFTQAFADPAGNAVGVMGDGPHQVVLLGHIDTVPGEIPVRVEPSAAIPLPGGEGLILYGRGSVDAKGALAAFTDAVAAVGPLEGWQLVVIGAVGEEGDSPGARYVIPVYHPEFAIIGEPSGWERVTLGYKGSAWSEITVRRSLAHTASQRESASEAAVRAWEALREWAAAFNTDRKRAFDQLQLTLRGMDSADNGFEERACLRVGARLPLDLPPEKWYAQMKQIPGIPETVGLELQPVGFPIPAYQGPKNTPMVRAFLSGIRLVGSEPGFVLKTGTADLNLVAPAWGCPALAYGPGNSSLDHTPQEHLSLEEYGKSVAVLRDVLHGLCASG
jgi:LysW-gamma-L-lysine carboxypeptidase